jgi:hypothetical protein
MPAGRPANTLEPAALEVRMDKIASELLVEQLADWSVDTVFGLPGDVINGIMGVPLSRGYAAGPDRRSFSA